MKTVAALMVLAGVAASANAAVTLAEWTFEVSVPATAGPHAAEGGLNAGAASLASGFHALATVYSNPVGNGSAESFSSNTWSVGDYYQFTTSTAGYNNITIAWDQTSSNTGPRDFNIQWSTDGVVFNNIGGVYSVLANAAPNPVWTSASGAPLYTFNVAGPAALDNQAQIYIRLTNANTISANGGTVAAGGTDRVDNVIIGGTLVPAPASLALVGLAGLVAGRRRR